jgi:nitroimidazol reductase NimA-like FMN-containing flavoprotein (pyridoxamine 5'-phosphate oxidase superfamily)
MTIETLDREECVRLLATQTVGRVVVVDHGSPHIVPVNYALDGDAIVFRTAVGTKLDGASRSPVAFEVDDLHAVDRTGWSVVVHGWAQEVTAYDDPALIARVEELPIDPWADFEKPHIVRIAPHTVTGRRVAPTNRPPKAREVLSHG